MMRLPQSQNVVQSSLAEDMQALKVLSGAAKPMQIERELSEAKSCGSSMGMGYDMDASDMGDMSMGYDMNMAMDPAMKAKWKKMSPAERKAYMKKMHAKAKAESLDVDYEDFDAPDDITEASLEDTLELTPEMKAALKKMPGPMRNKLLRTLAKSQERAKGMKRKPGWRNKGMSLGMDPSEMDEDEDLEEEFDAIFSEDEDDLFDIDSIFESEDEDDEDEEGDEEDEEDEEGMEESFFEDLEDAADVLASYASLDEDEAEDLDEEARDLIEMAHSFLAEAKKAKVEKPAQGKWYRKTGAKTFGNLKVRTPTAKAKKYLTKKNLRKAWKRFAKRKFFLNARALSRIAGVDHTLRGKAERGVNKVYRQVKKKLKDGDKEGAKETARQYIKDLGGKLTGGRLKARTARNARRSGGGKKSKAGDMSMGESRDELATLIEDFRGVLAEGLSDSAVADDETYETCEAIIEGFQKVGATAEELANRVSQDMRTLPESEDPREDPRFEVGTYLESIARDAQACLDQIIEYDADGNPYFSEGVDVDVALEDLQCITNDLERGIGALSELG